MQCNAFKKNLVAYLHGELDKKDVMTIHHHLSTCQTCVKEEIELRKTIRRLDKYRFEAMPDDFDLKLQQKLGQTKTPSRLITHDFRRVVYAVVATIFITIGIEFLAYQFLHRPGHISDFPTTQAIFKRVKYTASERTSRRELLLKKYMRIRENVLKKSGVMN